MPSADACDEIMPPGQKILPCSPRVHTYPPACRHALGERSCLRLGERRGISSFFSPCSSRRGTRDAIGKVILLSRLASRVSCYVSRLKSLPSAPDPTRSTRTGL